MWGELRTVFNLDLGLATGPDLSRNVDAAPVTGLKFEASRKCPVSTYLGGQGDLVSRLIMGINGVTIWVIGVTNLLTKSL